MQRTMTTPSRREFGKLTEDEVHELGHLAELQQWLTHNREHTISKVVRRLGIPEGVRFVFVPDPENPERPGETMGGLIAVEAPRE